MKKNLLSIACSLLALSFFTGSRASLAIDEDKTATPFKCTYETPHFLFRCLSNDRWARYYDNFLEQFLIIINTNYFPITPTWKITIYLYADQASMRTALRAKGFNRTVWGRYWRNEDAIYIYEGATIGMIAHEVMHKIDYENLREIEPWAREGIPTFFERIYGYRTAFGPVLYVGHQHPGRLKDVASELPNISIAKILDDAVTKDPLKESDKMLLSTFLFYEGKLSEYFKLAASGDHHGYDTLVEAACQTKMPVLEVKFKAFIQQIIANHELLAKLPRPSFFATEERFNEFYELHRDALQANPLPPLTTQRLEGDCKKTSKAVANDEKMKACKDAYTAYNSKDYPEALSKCNECLRNYPRNLWALSFKATIEHILKDDRNALATLGTALDVNPNSEQNLMLRAILLSHKKDYEGSLKDFARLNMLYPKNASHSGNLGEVLVMLKRYKEALPHLNLAVENLKIPECYYYRSVALRSLGQRKEAEQDLEISKKAGYVAGADTAYDPATKKFKVLPQGL